MEHKHEKQWVPQLPVTMDIVPILPGQPHPSILHILQKSCCVGQGCHPTDSSDMCGSIIVVIQYNRCYSKVDGGSRQIESASHAVLQKSKGILHLKRYA